jgi:hypothetical protein
MLRALASRLLAALAPRPAPRLACGACPRWERCGLPPRDACIEKALAGEREHAMRHAGAGVGAVPVSW